jgi:outer membrane protein assembly factor BamA
MILRSGLALLLLLSSPALAQPRIIQLVDSLFEAELPLVVAPIVYHSPETSWGLGASVSYVFKTSASETRVSNINTQFVRTRLGQSLFRLSSDIFSPGEKWFFQFYLGYRNYVDRFYGIGPLSLENQRENYSYRSLVQDLSSLRKFGKGLFAGLNMRYVRQYDLQAANGTSLNETLQGFNGINSWGIGPEFSWDTRNNIMSAQKGIYLHLLSRFHPGMGNENPAFQSYQLDIRHYQPVGKHVWANRFKSEHKSGQPPFQELALAGGSNFGRGYFEGRYRDRHLVGLESELRWQLWRMLGLTTFSSIFQLGNTPDQWFANPWRMSYGMGLRCFVNQADRLVVRLDYARTLEGHQAFYLSVHEAF